jgi:predicted CXXCH cytochrome family protein
MGVGGKDVPASPDKMFLARIGCRGCHIKPAGTEGRGTTEVAVNAACVGCHGKEYYQIPDTWRKSIDSMISVLGTAIVQVRQEMDAAGKTGVLPAQLEEKYANAAHNFRMVKEGDGVHNVAYSEELLRHARGSLNEILTGISSGYRIPGFRQMLYISDSACIICHMGIEEKSSQVYGLIFSHKTHVVGGKVNCLKCHSDEPKHGQLIIGSKDECLECHHSPENTDCNKCHGKGDVPAL